MRLRSLDEVASAVNAILPNDSVRHRQLSTFCDALEYVQSRGAELWLVHVTRDRIRLLVGRLIVLTLLGDRVWLASGTGEDAPSVPQLAAWQWDETSYPAYVLVPSRNRPAHFAFIDCVLARSRRLDPRSVARHEPMFVQYLNRVFGKEFDTGAIPPAETAGQPHQDL